jgi:hypothetical protein
VTLDLSASMLEINVNNGEFSYRFNVSVLPSGNPKEYWFGATFANDHKLQILENQSIHPKLVLDVAKVSWLRRLLDECRSLQHIIMQHQLEYPAVRCVNKLLQHDGCSVSPPRKSPRLQSIQARLRSPSRAVVGGQRVYDEVEEVSDSEDRSESDTVSRSESDYTDEDRDGDTYAEEDGEGDVSDEDDETDGARATLIMHLTRTESPGLSPRGEGREETPLDSGNILSRREGTSTPLSRRSRSTRSDPSVIMANSDGDVRPISPAELAETDNWLDSSLLANGLFDLSAPGADQRGQGVDGDMTEALYQQWKLLRQLTDAPNGMGDAQTLVAVMKKFVREDQGMLAGPNHAVHAACAALIWHEGLGGEALEIISAHNANKSLQSGQSSRMVRPSAAFLCIWKLGQSLRAIYPDNADGVDNSEYDTGVISRSTISGPRSNASNISSSSRNLGYVSEPNTVTSDADGDMALSPFPPAKLMKQFSLPVQEHGQGPLLPATLAAVRRARLLLGYLPAALLRCQLHNNQHGSHLPQGTRTRSDASASYYHRLRSECVSDGYANDYGTNPQHIHTFNKLKKGRSLTLSQCVMSFVQFGPDPDVLRRVADQRKLLAQARINSFSTVKSVLIASTRHEYSMQQLEEMSHDIRYISDVLYNLHRSIKFLGAASDPVSAAAHTSAVNTMNTEVENKGKMPMGAIDNSTFRMLGYHFAVNLNGTGAHTYDRLWHEWSEIVGIVSDMGLKWLKQMEDMSSPLRNHGGTPGIKVQEIAVLCALSICGLDFREQDIGFIGRTSMFTFLSRSAACVSSVCIRKAAFAVIESALHLCVHTQQCFLQACASRTHDTTATLPVDVRSSQAAQILLGQILQFVSNIFAVTVDECTVIDPTPNSIDAVDAKNRAVVGMAKNIGSVTSPVSDGPKWWAKLVPSTVPIFSGIIHCDPIEEGVSIHVQQRLPLTRRTHAESKISERSSGAESLQTADHSLAFWLFVPSDCANGVIMSRLVGKIHALSYLCIRLVEHKLCVMIGDKASIGNVDTSTIGTSSQAQIHASSDNSVLYGVNLKTFDGLNIVSREALPKRRWLHCGFTFDSKNEVCFLYVDGCISTHNSVPQSMCKAAFPYPELFKCDSSVHTEQANLISSQPFIFGQVPATFATIGRASTCLIGNAFLANRPLLLEDYALLGAATIPTVRQPVLHAPINVEIGDKTEKLSLVPDINGVVCVNPSTNEHAHTAYIAINNCEQCTAVVKLLPCQDAASIPDDSLSGIAIGLAVECNERIIIPKCEEFGERSRVYAGLRRTTSKAPFDNYHEVDRTLLTNLFDGQADCYGLHSNCRNYEQICVGENSSTTSIAASTVMLPHTVAVADGESDGCNRFTSNRCGRVMQQRCASLVSFDEYEMSVNFNAKTFTISQITPETNGYDKGLYTFDISGSLQDKIEKASVVAGSAGVSSAHRPCGAYFGVRLLPGQQVQLCNSTRETADTIVTKTTGNPTLDGCDDSDAVLVADCSILDGQLCDAVGTELEAQEATCLQQTVANWDTEFSDQRRVEISSFDTLAYYPGHTASASSSFSVPLVASRVSAPRASLTVMLGRNVLIQGKLSIGLARVSKDTPTVNSNTLETSSLGASPDRYASIAGGSFSRRFPVDSNRQAETQKFSKQVQTCFGAKGGFGISANSWGIVDARRGTYAPKYLLSVVLRYFAVVFSEENVSPARVCCGSPGEAAVEFRHLCEGDLVTWTIDFLSDTPWAQININGDEFVHRFANLHGHFSQYVIGCVLAMEHEVILIPDSSVLDSLPAPTVSTTASVVDANNGALSVQTQERHTAFTECNSFGSKAYTWKYSPYTHDSWPALRGSGTSAELRDDAGSSIFVPHPLYGPHNKSEVIRLCALIGRIFRSLLKLSLVANISKDSRVVDGPEVLVDLFGSTSNRDIRLDNSVTLTVINPFDGVFSDWLINSGLFACLLKLSFGASSVLLRNVGCKLLHYVLPLLSPTVVCTELRKKDYLVPRDACSSDGNGLRGVGVVHDCNLVASLLVRLGECLNPYRSSTAPQRGETGAYAFNVYPYSPANSARQVYLLLRCLAASPLRAWHDHVQEAIEMLLPAAGETVDNISESVDMAYDLMNRQMRSSSSLEPPETNVFNNSFVSTLLSLLAVFGGWQSSIGLSFGTVVRHLGAQTSIAEPHVIVGFGSIGMFGETLCVVPLPTADELFSLAQTPEVDPINQSGINNAAAETVFTFYLQNEQRKPTVPSAMAGALKQPLIQAEFTKCLDRILSIDITDLRPKLGSERADPDSKPPMLQLESIIVEPHPLSDFDGEIRLRRIGICDAQYLSITFDPATQSLQLPSSQLKFTDSSGAELAFTFFKADDVTGPYWGEQYYSNTTPLPGVGVSPPLKILADHFYLSVKTNSSATADYKFTVEGPVRIESVRPLRPPFVDLSLARLVKVFAMDALSRVIQLRFCTPAGTGKSATEIAGTLALTSEKQTNILSGKTAFILNTIPSLLHCIIAHSMFVGLFDNSKASTDTPSRKEIDFSYLPRASSSYLGRILQTLCGCNAFFHQTDGDVTDAVSGHRTRTTTRRGTPTITSTLLTGLDTAVPTVLQVNHRDMHINDDEPTGPVSLTPQLATSLFVGPVNAAGSNGVSQTCADFVNVSLLLGQLNSSTFKQAGRAVISDQTTDSAVPFSNSTVTIETINSDEDVGSAKFKLRCGSGSTHCRIRAKASLESAEVGDVANGTTMEISGKCFLILLVRMPPNQ